MRNMAWTGAAALMCVASPAAAEVKDVASGSFVIEIVTTIDKPRAEAWEILRSPAKWWSPDHTYSGDSANLFMDVQATGCFCERLPDKGSVEHGHIVYVAPGRMIRMSSALGPLQAEAVAGTLTLQLDSLGAGETKLTLTYLVGGHIRQGGEKLAPLVDRVLGEQVARFKAAAEAAPAPTKKDAKK